jgi:hypothetical protein
MHLAGAKLEVDAAKRADAGVGFGDVAKPKQTWGGVKGERIK